MEKVKSFLQNHKKACIIGAIVLFILIIVLLLFLIAPPIIGDNNYGHRLDGEKKYQIKTNTVDDIKDTIAKEDGVIKVTYHKEGRILNFTIKLENDLVLDSAKKYAEEIISKLSDKNKEYYDVQIFLDADNKGYPIIGYHSKGSEGISWGNVGE